MSGIGGILTARRANAAHAAENERTESPAVPARLLGAYDPLLLGWESRQPILGSAQRIVTVNGLFRPFALVRGRAVATWAMPRGEVDISPFGQLAGADAAALSAEASDVKRFLRGPDSPPHS